MKNITLVCLIVTGLALQGCAQQIPSQNTNLNGEYRTLDEYKASIDYSCRSDSDCTIKDVRNCCGYYPKCVNLNAGADPEFVAAACAREGLASACGYPSIDACRCIESHCEGYLTNADGSE